MTEIVNNNNGMAFDLLETGNSASTTSNRGGFSSFFADIDNVRPTGIVNMRQAI